jgi:PAS domain S-box-containing protein
MLQQYITGIMGMTIEEIRFHSRLLVNAFDQQHRVLFWNKKCEALFGISEEAALGRQLEDLLPWTRHHEKIIYLNNALRGEPIYIADDKYDINNNYYDQVVLPLKDNNGDIFAALNIVIDQVNNETKTKARSKFSLVLHNTN